MFDMISIHNVRHAVLPETIFHFFYYEELEIRNVETFQYEVNMNC